MVDVVEVADEGLGNSSWLVDLGEGSAPAASILERVGRDDVAVFVAGPEEWSAEGTPA